MKTRIYIAILILILLAGIIIIYRSPPPDVVVQEVAATITVPAVAVVETVASTAEATKQITETPVIPISPLPSATVVRVITGEATKESPTSLLVHNPTVIATTVPTKNNTAEPTMTTTPVSVVTVPVPTSPPVLETPSSNKVEYSAEKISLAPVELSFDLPGISAQGAEVPQINFAGWSNSGQQFAFVIPKPIVLTVQEGNNTYKLAELWIANIDGTDFRKITDKFDGLVLWSPDDTQIVYYKRIGVRKRELWVVNLNTNIEVKLDELPEIINKTDIYGNMRWLDNQHLFYPTYFKGKTISRYLWIHNIKTGQVNKVLIDNVLSNLWRDIDIAPNKKSIIGSVSVDNRAEGLWLGELVQEDNKWRLNYIKTLISADIVISYWSPDSSKLAIKSLSQFTKTNILQIMDINSNEVIEIPFLQEPRTVDWSYNSNTLIVTTYSGSGLPFPVYTVNADGSNLQQLGVFFFSYIRWSPDSQHLGLFSSDDTNANNPFGIIKVEVNQ